MAAVSRPQVRLAAATVVATVGVLLLTSTIGSPRSHAGTDCLSDNVYAQLGLSVEPVAAGAMTGLVGVDVASAAAAKSWPDAQVVDHVVANVWREGDPLADGRAAYLFVVESNFIPYVHGGIPDGSAVEVCSLAMVDAKTGKWLTTHHLTTIWDGAAKQ
jgi:hypothetical protein